METFNYKHHLLLLQCGPLYGPFILAKPINGRFDAAVIAGVYSATKNNYRVRVVSDEIRVLRSRY